MHFVLIKMDIVKNHYNTYWQEFGEIGTPVYCWWGCKTG